MKLPRRTFLHLAAGRCRAASYVTVRPVVMVSVGKGRLEGMAARHLLLFAKDLFVAASPRSFDLGQNLGAYFWSNEQNTLGGP